MPARHEKNSEATYSQVDNLSATVTGTGVIDKALSDFSQCNYVRLVVTSASVTGTLKGNIEGSLDSTNWFTLVALTDIVGAATTSYILPGSGAGAAPITPYIRLNVTAAPTTAAISVAVHSTIPVTTA